MELQDNELTNEEKLIYILNVLEESSKDNTRKEELNKLKKKLILESNSENKNNFFN